MEAFHQTVPVSFRAEDRFDKGLVRLFFPGAMMSEVGEWKEIDWPV